METKFRAMHWMMRAAFAAAACAILFASPNAAEAWTYHLLHTFCKQQDCTDGIYPADVILTKSGGLRGITFGGGARGAGAAFDLRQPHDGTKWKYRTFFGFCSCSDGGYPDPRLLQDRHGNLYGITDLSIVQAYKLTPGGALQNLYHFSDRAGSMTYRGASTGAPYDGGSLRCGVTGTDNGVIFALTPEKGGLTWDYSIVYTFCVDESCSDGKSPAWVIADQAGNLLGVTSNGGQNNQGVAFELKPTSKGFKQSVLYNFCNIPPTCADGQGPTGLTMDLNDNLFGTMYAGGATGSGTVYKIATRGKRSSFTLLHTFCADSGCPDGSSPQIGIAIDANGNIFGPASSGGAHRAGTVFEISGKRFRTLHDFCSLENCADGNFPLSLSIDAAGNIFGVTQNGGNDSDGGVAFELTP